jgi:short-subunit dehydrogenase
MSISLYKEHVAVITGASSGIGYEMALQLADQGAWLALAARRKEPLEELAEECRTRGGRALVIPTDVSEEKQCQNLIEQTVKEYGRVDTLFNNAGITIWAKFEDMQVLFPYEKVMQVNYLGSLYCTYYALPYLKQNQGRIVAVSSLAGKTGVPFRSGYSATKFAMAGFFRGIRVELAQYGISVTIVYPDYVQTDTRLKAFGPDGKTLQNQPLRRGKRMITVEECSRKILSGTAKRKREVVLSFRGKLAPWINLIAPALVDRVVSRAVTDVRQFLSKSNS